jgi:hypothetical protein
MLEPSHVVYGMTKAQSSRRGIYGRTRRIPCFDAGHGQCRGARWPSCPWTVSRNFPKRKYGLAANSRTNHVAAAPIAGLLSLTTST